MLIKPVCVGCIWDWFAVRGRRAAVRVIGTGRSIGFVTAYCQRRRVLLFSIALTVAPDDEEVDPLDETIWCIRGSYRQRHLACGSAGVAWSDFVSDRLARLHSS